MTPFININGNTYCLVDIKSISEIESLEKDGAVGYSFRIYGLINQDKNFTMIAISGSEAFIKYYNDTRFSGNSNYFNTRYIPEDKDPRKALEAIRENILQLWADFKSSVPII